MTEPKRPRNSRFVTALFCLVLGLAAAAFVWMMKVYAASIIFGLVLVSLFYPVFSRILRRIGDRRRVAAAVTTLLVILVVLVPISGFVTSLTAEVFTIYERATGDQPMSEKVLEMLYDEDSGLSEVLRLAERAGVDVSPEKLQEHATSAGKTVATYLYDKLGGLASNVFKLLVYLGLMLVVMFAVFSEGPALKAYVLDLSPLPDNQEEKIVERFTSISRAVFVGNGVAALLQGIIGGIGFYAFGVGSGVLWGTAMAFFAFLPVVGSAIVFVPAAIYLMLQGEVGLGVGFVIYNVAFGAALEYGLKPRLIGGQGKMNGVLVFLGILSGLAAFESILGLFYGPLILTMFLTIAEIYKSEYRDDLMAIRSPWVRSDRGDAMLAAPLAATAAAALPPPASEVVTDTAEGDDSGPVEATREETDVGV